MEKRAIEAHFATLGTQPVRKFSILQAEPFGVKKVPNIMKGPKSQKTTNMKRYGGGNTGLKRNVFTNNSLIN